MYICFYANQSNLPINGEKVKKKEKTKGIPKQISHNLLYRGILYLKFDDNKLNKGNCY